MANETKVRDAVKDFLLKMKALDSQIPEELMEDALTMSEGVKDGLNEVEEKEDVEDEDTTEEKKEGITSKNIEDAVSAVLLRHGLIKDASMKSLDKLEEELEGEGEKEDTEDADNEEAVTVNPEKINDSDSVKDYIRKMKPIIANIKDSKQRKMMADSVAAIARLNHGSNDQYSKIMEVTRKNAADEASKQPQPADYDFGKEIAKRYNPHYKEEK